MFVFFRVGLFFFFLMMGLAEKGGYRSDDEIIRKEGKFSPH